MQIRTWQIKKEICPLWILTFIEQTDDLVFFVNIIINNRGFFHEQNTEKNSGLFVFFCCSFYVCPGQLGTGFWFYNSFFYFITQRFYTKINSNLSGPCRLKRLINCYFRQGYYPVSLLFFLVPQN